MLTSLPRLSELTKVRGFSGEAPAKITVGTPFGRTPGVTMRLPKSDSTTMTEVSEDRVAWTTRSQLLRFIPSQMHWSYILEDNGDGTRVIYTLESAFMLGVPIGALVKLQFLPFHFLARGTMMISGKQLVRSLS